MSQSLWGGPRRGPREGKSDAPARQAPGGASSTAPVEVAGKEPGTRWGPGDPAGRAEDPRWGEKGPAGKLLAEAQADPVRSEDRPGGQRRRQGQPTGLGGGGRCNRAEGQTDVLTREGKGRRAEEAQGGPPGGQVRSGAVAATRGSGLPRAERRLSRGHRTRSARLAGAGPRGRGRV